MRRKELRPLKGETKHEINIYDVTETNSESHKSNHSMSSSDKETSFSRDVFRHFKDIIKHNNQQQKNKMSTDTDEEEYGFKELEQKLKERREKEKEDLKKCQEAEESAKRLKQLEREQNQKLPKPKQCYSSPRTRNSIAACGPTRRSYESVMTSQTRQTNFVRTPNLNRRQREHIVQQLEKFKKPQCDVSSQQISRRKESSASQPSQVAAPQVVPQGQTFQVAMQYRDVKYCNDPRNRRFAVDQRSGTAVQSSYQGNILPFVLTKVTSQGRNPGVYYDDTMTSSPQQQQRSNKNANNSVNRHKPPAYPVASSRENLRGGPRNAFMTSQEMYEENRERRKVQREMRKMNKNNNATQSGRQPPLNGAREQTPQAQVHRCASEENVFSSSQDRNQVLNKRHLRRQKSADDSASSSSLRRRHTLGTGDDVIDDDGRRPPPSGGNGRNQPPPDYNEHRRKSSMTSSASHRVSRHKKESYL